MTTFLISKIINNDEGSGLGMSDDIKQVSFWAGRWGEYYKIKQELLEKARRGEPLEIPKECLDDTRAVG